MMPDFFSKLAARTLEVLPLVRPAVTSLYAPDRFHANAPLQTDTGDLAPQDSLAPAHFPHAKNAPPSVSGNIATNDATRPAQSLEAPPDTTERLVKQPFTIAASPSHRRPAREDAHASTDHASRNHDSEKGSRNATTRHQDNARAGEAQALERSAAERERQRLANERSAPENARLENNPGRTSAEASGRDDATSAKLLVVKPYNGRAQSGEETGARPSRVSEQTPFTPSPVIAGHRTAAADSVSNFRQREESPAPTIHVSIGRIEVRAVMTPAHAAPRKVSTPQPERSSLEEYLRSRRGGTER